MLLEKLRIWAPAFIHHINVTCAKTETHRLFCVYMTAQAVGKHKDTTTLGGCQ
ncbi:hypothetical protein AB434_1948 [Heyndrickxia coagulans]|uniref:Uncharacterized protein n=1 Tax=Heyndrickxia coagulans TaxID=1398 RepID=A0A133KDY7_HEYCO|nr:hypothetical protein AB434_1948 [Heyndrickxia coagulans]KWZ77803.1 hypothetical protein HMPREF3213_03233 [Heyndrickxia coagulans]